MADNQELISKELSIDLKRRAEETLKDFDYYSDTMIPDNPEVVIEAAQLIRDLQEQLTQTQQALDRAVEALKDLHDDINGRKEDGQAFNPGTLFALGRARSVLASIKE